MHEKLFTKWQQAPRVQWKCELYDCSSVNISTYKNTTSILFQNICYAVPKWVAYSFYRSHSEPFFWEISGTMHQVRLLGATEFLIKFGQLSYEILSVSKFIKLICYVHWLVSTIRSLSDCDLPMSCILFSRGYVVCVFGSVLNENFIRYYENYLHNFSKKCFCHFPVSEGCLLLLTCSLFYHTLGLSV